MTQGKTKIEFFIRFKTQSLFFILVLLVNSIFCIQSYSQSKTKKIPKIATYKGERKEDSAAIKSYFKNKMKDKILHDSMTKNATLDYLEYLVPQADTITTLTISASTLSVLPESFKKFKKLQVLKLFRCKSIYLRDLFEKISTFPELHTLEIVFSDKTEIPNNIYKLIHIKNLNLSNNKLKKLPDSIVYLKNLTSINLMHNHYLEIQGSFEKLAKLEALTSLDFSYSQLDTLPPALGNLKKLQRLDLSDNRFNTLPNNIASLTNLVFLNLNNCIAIDGIQAFNVIGTIASLEELSMNGCMLKMIPTAIGNLKQIKKLHFRNNEITDISSGIQNMSALEYLDLSTDFFSKYKNQLKEIPSSLGKCTKLHTLICINNQLKSIPSALDQTSLTTLDISWNRIEKFPAVIGKLTQLKVLNLSLNPINMIDEQIGNLKLLENFQMAGDFRLPAKNKIKKIPESIGLCKNLKVLNLRDHVISELPASLFQLTLLEDLILMDNLLTGIPAEIQNLKHLKSINIKANELETVPFEMSALKELQFVNIAYNPKLEFTTVFAILAKLPTLNKLDISYNEIQMFQVKEFQKIKPGIKIIKLEIANKVTKDQIMKDEERQKR